MSLRPALLVFAALATLPSLAHRLPSQTPPSRTTIAITHVTVIDVERGTRLPDRTVVVRDGRIESLTGSGVIPRGSTVVDGRGKFLMPGLWDMHVHVDVGGIATNLFFPLFVANGITGIREMGSDCLGRPACEHGMTIDTVRTWRSAIDAGTLVGPRVVASSPMLDGPHPTWQVGYPLGDSASARAAVDTFARRRVDFLKVYSLVPRAAFFSLAREAKAKRLPFAGHVPIDVPTLDAAKAGMATMEHGNGLQEGCSSRESTLRFEQRRIVEDAIAQRDPVPQVEPIYVEQFDRAVASFDATRCRALMQTFARSHTAQTPTLVHAKSLLAFADSTRLDDPRMRYIPSWVRASWERFVEPPPMEVRDVYTARSGRLLWLAARVRDMKRAGVTILAGTDAGNAYIYPGFSLHDELALFVNAGLTPAEALRTATIDAARVLHLADSSGSVTVGKRADLLLLDADPLAEIGNTKRIAAVIADGRLYDRAALDALLGRVEAWRAATRRGAP